MCMDYDDLPEFCDERILHARKQHKCDECGRQIAPGEKYHRASGKWADGFCTYRTCEHCAVAQRWLADNCDGYAYQMIEEDIEAHARDYRRIDLARIAVGMRRGWVTRKGAPMPVPEMPRQIA